MKLTLAVTSSGVNLPMSAIVRLSVPAILFPVLVLMFLYAGKKFSFGIRHHPFRSDPFGLARILIRLSDYLNVDSAAFQRWTSRTRPVGITSKTVTASDVNVMFIPAIFFSKPEIGNALKFGKFSLNQIAIKFWLGLSPASAAMSIVKATLKQKPVVGLIYKKLSGACR